MSTEFPECRCATGVCSETCTEVRFWIPDAGVDDYFLLTKLIPGQTETKYIGSSLYIQSGGICVPTELKQPNKPLARRLGKRPVCPLSALGPFAATVSPRWRWMAATRRFAHRPCKGTGRGMTTKCLVRKRRLQRFERASRCAGHTRIVDTSAGRTAGDRIWRRGLLF